MFASEGKELARAKCEQDVIYSFPGEGNGDMQKRLAAVIKAKHSFIFKHFLSTSLEYISSIGIFKVECF